MPKSPLNRIAHIAHTNHRIVRRPEEALDPSLASAAGFDLAYENTRSQQAEADLRSRALAYSEAALGLPAFTGRARRLLEDALKAGPRDADLTAAYGLVLRGAGADGARQSTEFLERAVEFGSRSSEVRLVLCELLAGSGQTERAVPQCRSAIELAPNDPAAYLLLIRLRLRQGDRAGVSTLLDRLRVFDPANPALPELVRQAGEGK
jgi:tetratricopeptide (TPR) repeat protein